MEAYISGTAGMAVIINGADTDAELYYADKVEPVVIASHVAWQIICSNEDTIFFQNTSKNIVLEKLSKEANKTTCLMMFLSILDSGIEDVFKINLIDHLNNLFIRSIDAYDYVCNIMFSRPLPENSIKKIPSEIINNETKLYKLLDKLFECQPNVIECTNIFKNICMKRNLEVKQSSYIEGVLVNQGFFYIFSSNQADINFLNNVHFSILNNLKNADIPNVVNLVSCIKTDFKHLVRKGEGIVSNLLSNNFSESKAIKYEVKEKKTSNLESFQKVRKQLEAIKLQLRNNLIPKAKRMAQDLIDDQVGSGNNEFAAQSLCQLSEYAKKLNLYQLQLEWALQATSIAPLDYRTYGHTADAYVNLEDFIGAQKYFEICLNAHDDNRLYGLTGLARIERSRYNLGAAMSYIEDAIKECGKEYIPYLIKAELLREQHQYKESEDIYNFVCNEFPQYCIPQCGKAAVFAEQKRFSDAEETYGAALKNYTKNEDQCSILSGLGFLIARLGRFEESHKLLDKSISLATYENIVPLASKAKILQMEGRYKESEDLLKSLLSRNFPEATEQLLALYLKNNELEKAMSLYNSSALTIQDTDIVKIRYSQLLKRQNKFDEALEVIDKLRTFKPKNTLAMNARAAIFKEKGDYHQALLQYSEVIRVNRYDRVAKFGIEAINHFLNESVGVENIICNADVDNPLTIDDYQTIGNMGLLKLAKGEIKEGKRLLQQSCSSNFKGLSFIFSSGLSLASLMLNQKNAALKNIKKPMNVFSHIQKAIIYGEFGKKEQVISSLKNIAADLPLFTRDVIAMIELRYLSAANDDHISQHAIYQEQLKNILLAA